MSVPKHLTPYPTSGQGLPRVLLPHASGQETPASAPPLPSVLPAQRTGSAKHRSLTH